MSDSLHQQRNDMAQALIAANARIAELESIKPLLDAEQLAAEVERLRIALATNTRHRNEEFEQEEARADAAESEVARLRVEAKENHDDSWRQGTRADEATESLATVNALLTEVLEYADLSRRWAHPLRDRVDAWRRELLK